MFILSKIIGFLISPLTVTLTLFCVSVGARTIGWRRISAVSGWLSVALTLLITLTPVSEMALGALENQYERPAPVDLDAYAGAIVLGGGQGSGVLAQAHDTYQLSEAGERLMTVVELRAMRDDFPILLSGGDGRIFAEGWNEEALNRKFLEAAGLDPESVLFEARSRNTFENAAFTAELLPIEDTRPWLLVTSASHMPRAMRIFTDQGLNVVAFPVDHQAPDPAWRLGRIDPFARFKRMDTALHEYVGMQYYLWLQRR